MEKRTKTQQSKMLPTKKFLSAREARNYLDMGETNFYRIVKENDIAVSVIDGKRYYSVTDLDKLFTPILTGV